MEKYQDNYYKKNMLSVIIPVYNTAQYLEQCIRSVLNSTYSNLEIICVDDGSTDGSGELLDRLAKSDARIKAIHTANRGVSKARNTALAVAAGEFVTFVDSDDWIEPDYYAVMLNKYKPAYGLLVCDYFLNFEENREKKREVNASEAVVNGQEALKKVFLQDWFKGFLWNKIFLNEIISEHGFHFDESVGYCEDLLFITQYILACDKVYYSPTPFYHYRMRNGSATGGGNYKSTFSGVESYKKIVALLEENTVDEAIVKRATAVIPSLCVKTIKDMAANKTYDRKVASACQKHIAAYKREYIACYGNKYRLFVWLAGINPKLLYLLFIIKSD